MRYAHNDSAWAVKFNQMDREEDIVFDYVTTNISKDLLFEPDGNVTPDFLLDSRIAIEVRRLNQHIFDNESADGLEKIAYPLIEAFQEILESFDKPNNESTYFVSIDFRRPLTNGIKGSKKDIRHALKTFLEEVKPELPFTISANEEIDISIFLSTKVDGHLFRRAGDVDNDAGGAVVDNYIKNIGHCIIEKSKKIEPNAQKYKTWWLFLVDYMGWLLTYPEEEIVRSSLINLGNFDRVCLLSINGGKMLLDINLQKGKRLVRPFPHPSLQP